MAAYELTIRGQTRQFDTPEEMEEWRQRMLAPRVKRTYKKPPKSNKKVTYGLAKFLRDENRNLPA